MQCDPWWSFYLSYNIRSYVLLFTAKAALQTDEAESQLVTIKREFLAHKGQSQEQLKNLQQALQVNNDV